MQGSVRRTLTKGKKRVRREKKRRVAKPEERTGGERHAFQYGTERFPALGGGTESHELFALRFRQGKVPPSCLAHFGAHALTQRLSRRRAGRTLRHEFLSA